MMKLFYSLLVLIFTSPLIAQTAYLTEESHDKVRYAELPTPVKVPIVGTTEYSVTINMHGNKIESEMTSTVEDGGDHWILTDISKSEKADMVDVAKLKKGSLEAISRKLTRGGMVVDVIHEDDAITGNILMRGKNIPLNIANTKTTFGDGTALGTILAQLPLKEGYTTMYRTFDPLRQKVVNYKLTVTGSEDVITAQGPKDSYHLLLEDKDGSGSKTLMWMSKDENPKMLKMKATLASMGGANMTVNIK